jgi:hypothetical protein
MPDKCTEPETLSRQESLVSKPLTSSWKPVSPATSGDEVFPPSYSPPRDTGFALLGI